MNLFELYDGSLISEAPAYVARNYMEFFPWWYDRIAEVDIV